MQASGSLERGTWSRPLLSLNKTVTHHTFSKTGFWCTCTICFVEEFEDGFEQKRHEERSPVQDLRTWVEVWNWFYGRSPDRSALVCNLCEDGNMSKLLFMSWLAVALLDLRPFFCKLCKPWYPRWETLIVSCMGTEHLRHQFNHLFDNISDCDI